MSGTVALLSSRFYDETNNVPNCRCWRHNDWTKRIRDLLLPNASLICTLVIDLPLEQGQLSTDEVSHVRALAAADRTKHLAVVWTIWAKLRRTWGALEFESLYLIWDGTHPAVRPSLAYLQHPAALKDLAVYAPPNLRQPELLGQLWCGFYLPDMARCANLACVAYAANRTSFPRWDRCALDEWLAKADGNPSVLEHPPLCAT
ncbi:hypothetical protein MSAN_02196400 [Mycena sanguinolenta]|uniref:Uncharacterized protein n=1 Tax=Mycena sanguinolenta TaxID=230812 RepID=A0A8H7CII8_9AGAR|nr:hypothetical protein MSAN_02196400 [Mycena sanguinolenta]